jgi:serine protease AprX
LEKETAMNNNRKYKIFSALLVIFMAAALLGGCAAPQAQAAMESVIISGTDSRSVASLVTHFGGTVTSRLDVIDGVAAQIPVSAEDALRKSPGITSVVPNGTVTSEDQSASLLLDQNGQPPSTDYPNEVGADQVWAQGDHGEGVGVAVLDSGIAPLQGLADGMDANHADRNNGRGSDRKNNPRISAWIDFVDGSKDPIDPNGHGTHVSGIIANSDVGADGEWNGIAPAVNLIGVRVLNEQGSGTYEQVLKGLDWTIKNQKKYNIRVINLSLIGQTNAPYWADPLNIAVTKAWSKGITVVAAAGNGGPNPLTIGSPGNNPYAITVGAFTDHYTPADWSDDYIADFSSAGPTKDMFVKPDLVAPGAHIVSSMSPDSYIAQQHQANLIQGNYFSMAGTSQAAAVVSGVAALIISNHADITPDQVKYRLLSTAFPWVDPKTNASLYSVWQEGSGRVNAVDATFADTQDAANQGLNIQADLAGAVHYEGYTVLDPATGQYSLQGNTPLKATRYGLWSGRYGMWSGGYGAWSNGFGVWSGKYGLWSGKYGLWPGKYGLWSGGFGVWSGKYGLWSGKYGLWSGKYGLWSGAADPNADLSQNTASIDNWVEEH